MMERETKIHTNLILNEIDGKIRSFIDFGCGGGEVMTLLIDWITEINAGATQKGSVTNLICEISIYPFTDTGPNV